MAEKDLDDLDKDYGLPKVEIMPLSHSKGPAPLPIISPEETATEAELQGIEARENAILKPPIIEEPKEQELDKEVPKEPEAEKANLAVEPPKEVAFQKSYQGKDEPGNISSGKIKQEAESDLSKSRSYAWIWVVGILGIGLGGWALFNFYQGQTDVEPEPLTETVEETPPATPAPPVEEEIEEPIQDIGLTEIRGREANPRFFVVVGSFTNEDIAKDSSDNINQKQINTFLVYPYGEVKNYRLAIAHFPSFDQAMIELNRVKGDFKEDLWVLKY